MGRHMKFKSDLRNIFFAVAERNAIELRNPVTRAQFKDLHKKRIRVKMPENVKDVLER